MRNIVNRIEKLWLENEKKENTRRKRGIINTSINPVVILEKEIDWVNFPQYSLKILRQ